MALLEIKNVHKSFGGGDEQIQAIRGLDLGVHRGETVGLVGESGCGKTTLCRVAVGLTRPTTGSVLFEGAALSEDLSSPDVRRRVQMVFQHPEQSLNPRMSVGKTISEPLLQLRGMNKSEVGPRVTEILQFVGLSAEHAARRPRDLSGGQKQRASIARALVCEPDLVVLDEPTSSLDVSVRSRIIGLLKLIREERHVAYLYVSHDLSTVRQIADRVAVMYLGRIVEVGYTEEVFQTPKHPYTKALVSAIPSMWKSDKQRIVLQGDVPSPADPPSGCAFRTRCPSVFEACGVVDPALQPMAENSSKPRWCACHLYGISGTEVGRSHHADAGEGEDK